MTQASNCNHDHPHSHGQGHGHSHPNSDHHHGQHGHDHHHHHLDSSQLQRSFYFGMWLNLAYVIFEFGMGWFTNSVALLADAGHNLQDVLSLAMSALALKFAERPATAALTYGYKKLTILSALAGSILLTGTCGAIAWEAISRLREPPEVLGQTVMWVALVGVVINITSALFFVRHTHELNARSALIHLLGDAAISLAVAASGFAIAQGLGSWLDPALSLVVAAVIFYSAWRLLRTSLVMAMDGVPDHLRPEDIKASLCRIQGVHNVHHLHVWSISTTETALTAHVGATEQANNQLLAQIKAHLRDKFKITHSTIQIEMISPNEATTCATPDPHAPQTGQGCDTQN